MSFEVRFDESSLGVMTVFPVGPMTAANAPRFTEAVEAKLPSDNTVWVIDLVEVSMLDSTGLGALVKLKKALTESKSDMVTVHAQPTVETAMKIMRMTSHLKAFVDRKELDEYLVNVQSKMLEKGGKDASG